MRASVAPTQSVAGDLDEEAEAQKGSCSSSLFIHHYQPSTLNVLVVERFWGPFQPIPKVSGFTCEASLSTTPPTSDRLLHEHASQNKS